MVPCEAGWRLRTLSSCTGLADIEKWVPGGMPGVVVFDDYYDEGPAVNVKKAVDELLSTDLGQPKLHTADQLTWVTKR